MSKFREQFKELNGRYDRLKAQSLKNDGKIDASEQRRLDAIGAQMFALYEAHKKQAQEKLDKIMTAVGSKLKTDPSQVKAFRYDVKWLVPDAQIIAADVLNVLYAGPRPADPAVERKQIRKLLGELPADESMDVGKALNMLGVYIPNLKEDSPGAEDASARIKKMHMAAYYPGSEQADYVRDLISQAKKEGFKIALQIKGSAEADPAKKKAENKKLVDDLKARIAADMAGTIANVAELEKYVEILPADEVDWIWSEDNKWLSVDGKTIRTSPDISDATQEKLQRFTRASKGEGHHTAGKKTTDPESNEFPAGLVADWAAQGAVDTWEHGVPGSPDPDERPHLSAAALAKATGKTVVTNRTYNEGGNMLTGTLPNGQPYGVIGRDGVLLSMFHLQEQFDADPKKVPEFDASNVKKRVGAMKFDATEVSQTIEKLTAIGTIAAGDSTAKKEEKAKEALAKIDIVKDIFAQDTKIPREQLTFVAQPDFHIDMHMRPLGPGQIMVNDFKANIALIDDALKRATRGSWEEKQLQSMRDHTAKMEKVMGPVVDEIERQSKAGGLEVVRAPGVMEGQFESVKFTPTTMYPRPIPGTDPPQYLNIGTALGLTADKAFTRKELADALATKLGGTFPAGFESFFDEILDHYFTRHVNFMNAIPGTTAGTNEQFYMTNYTSIKPLREAYEAYLKGKGVESVRWIGDDGGGQSTRSASEESLQLSGGLDCRENH